jgi:hypothetical protein
MPVAPRRAQVRQCSAGASEMSGRVRSLAERHDALKRDADARVSGPPAPFDQCCFDQPAPSARRLSRAADGVPAAGAALESRRLEEVDRREGAEARAARLEAQLREARAPASCVRTKHRTLRARFGPLMAGD